MTGFVSNRWMRVIALAAPMSIVALLFTLQGYPWAGLVWVSLAFSAVLWSGTGSTRSITQVIDGEAEPVPTAVLRSTGNRPRKQTP